MPTRVRLLWVLSPPPPRGLLPSAESLGPQQAQTHRGRLSLRALPLGKDGKGRRGPGLAGAPSPGRSQPTRPAPGCLGGNQPAPSELVPGAAACQTPHTGHSSSALRQLHHRHNQATVLTRAFLRQCGPETPGGDANTQSPRRYLRLAG